MTYCFLIYQFAPLPALLTSQVSGNTSSLLLAKSDRISSLILRGSRAGAGTTQQHRNQDSSKEQSCDEQVFLSLLERDLYNIAVSLCSTLQLFFLFYLFIYFIQNTVQLTQKSQREERVKGNIIQTGILNQNKII